MFGQSARGALSQPVEGAVAQSGFIAPFAKPVAETGSVNGLPNSVTRNIR